MTTAAPEHNSYARCGAPSAPAKRAYNMADWQRANADGPTQARGALLAADNDEPEPVKTFKQIDDEASAEQRRIVRGIVASHQSDREAVAAHHREECAAGFDSSPRSFPCRDDLEGADE